jgi:WD40 repeat protein
MAQEDLLIDFPAAVVDPDSIAGQPRHEPQGTHEPECPARADFASTERWLDALIADQRRRWQKGERDVCRSYLSRSYFARGSNRLAAAELIYHEFLLRQEFGEAPRFDEHIGRYPEYAEDARKLRDADLTLEQAPPVPRGTEISRVGDYELLELVARGGMGVVFKAREVSLDRIVALKMIPDGSFAAPAQLERLRIEAALAAALSHPNIVAVHHVGEHAGQPYVVMEYVEGTSLAAMARDDGLSPERAAGYLIKIAEAVHHAHQHGTLHRDLKPSNIIIDDRGEPRITDFGLARRLGGASQLTITGQALGTPGYMPPEQADYKRGEIGPGSDVYGLGATLYHLLTGRPPFTAETPLETLRLVIESEVLSPRLINPRVPRDLETICLKCLQKNPLARYATAQDLADDLKRFREGWPVRARREPAWERGLKLLKRRRLEFALGALSFVVFLVVVWLRFAELRHAAELARQELVLAEERASKEQADAAARASRQMAQWQEFRALENGIREKRTNRAIGWTWTCLDELGRAARLAPEIRNLIDLRREAAICLAGIDVRRVSTWEMPGEAQVDHVAYSPDGRWLALVQQRGVLARQLRLVDLKNNIHHDLTYPGPVQNDARDTGGGIVVFSPDGRWLALGTKQGSLYAWDTRRPDFARCDREAAHRQGVTGLAFAPDGKTLVSCSADATAKLWDLSSGWTETGTTALENGCGGITFSPDGQALACCVNDGLVTLTAQALELDNAIGSAARREFAVAEARIVRFSRDGRLLATSDSRRHLVLLDTESLNLIRTFADPALDDAAHENELTGIDVTPDGALLLSSSWDRTVKLWEAATGRLLVTIKAVAADREIVFAALQPDGRRMAITSGMQTAIYEIGGRAVRSIAAEHADPVRAIAFSRDAAALACVSDRSFADFRHQGEFTIWDWNTGTKTAAQASAGSRAVEAQGAVAFAPDGTLVAYAHSSPAMCLSQLGASSERTTMRLNEPPSCLAFSRDGRTLWAGIGRRLVSWQVGDTAPASCWSNDLGEYLKGWSGIASIAVGKYWVIAGCQDDSARIFRTSDGTKPVATWASPGGSVGSVALSGDERLALLGTLSGRVRVVSVPGGEPVADLAGHADEVTSVAFGPGDRLLATAALDGTIRLFSREHDKFNELLSLPSPGGVVAVRFSPDGNQLAFVVKNEAAVRIWHLDRLKNRLDAMNLGW